MVRVPAAVIGRCVTTIICFHQGDSKRESEMNWPHVLLLIVRFVRCGSALILRVSDICKLTPCKGLGRSLKSVS